MRLNSLSTDLAAGVLFIALAAFAVWYGWGYPQGTSLRMGAGYFPRLVSTMLMVVGCLLVLKSLFVGGSTIGSIPVRPLLVVLTGTLLFGLLIERAGFVVASSAMTVMARLADDEFKPLEVALLTIVLLLVTGAIFWWGLSLPFHLLPPGIG